MSRHHAIAVMCLLLVSGAPGPSAVAVDAEVRDISGGKYFDAVHRAFRKAENSIFVAMFEMRVYEDRKSGPHYTLIRDLIDACRRGVRVKVCLDRGDETDVEAGERPVADRNSLAYGLLRDGGVDVRYVNSGRRLHAKLIVIDEQTVVESSSNWSYSALTKNSESGTLIVSREYAAQKIRWIEGLEVENAPAPNPSRRSGGGRSGRR